MGFFDRFLDMVEGQSPRREPVSVDLPEVEGKARYRFVFRGQVQGVGFRYTVRLEAQALSITGWVHNHYDGSVIAELQGENKAIMLLLYRIQEGRFIRIDSIEADPIPVDEDERGFSVK